MMRWALTLFCILQLVSDAMAQIRPTAHPVGNPLATIRTCLQTALFQESAQIGPGIAQIQTDLDCGSSEILIPGRVIFRENSLCGTPNYYCCSLGSASASTNRNVQCRSTREGTATTETPGSDPDSVLRRTSDRWRSLSNFITGTWGALTSSPLDRHAVSNGDTAVRTEFVHDTLPRIFIFCLENQRDAAIALLGEAQRSCGGPPPAQNTPSVANGRQAHTPPAATELTAPVGRPAAQSGR